MNSKMPDQWPPYQIGPRQSIFAMGVVSVKFAKLESVLIFMFATVLGFGSDEATKIASKVGTRTCLHLMSAKLATNDWPHTTTELVNCFIDAASVCADNRNHLMHSNLAWTGDDHTVLFKTSKKGNTIVGAPTLSELRRVADDMNELVLFGRHLANAINNTSAEIPIFPASAFPWPIKPRMPVPLEFTSEPAKRCLAAIRSSMNQSCYPMDASWQRSATLRFYITKLPKAEHDSPEWQSAMEALLFVAEHTSAGYLGMTLKTLETTYGHHHPDHQSSVGNAFSKKKGAAA